MDAQLRRTGGPLALLGSGEYTAAMTVTDQLLLTSLHRQRPRVALLPTASGLEPGMPAYWNQRGVHHFERLGCEVLPIPLITRADAQNTAYAEQIAGSDLIYFSGGQPDYLVETLAGSAAWAAVQQVLADGGAVAGCSAGAMMMGALTISIRSVLQGGRLQWHSALGIAGNLVIIPHFDRIHLYLPDDQLLPALRDLPPHVTVVGIDEYTALIDCGDGWQVSGLHTVTIFTDGGPQIYRAGQRPTILQALTHPRNS